MTVESKTATSPSISTGTWPCGVTAKNSGGFGPQSVFRLHGTTSVSYPSFFSVGAMRTLALNGLNTPDQSFIRVSLLGARVANTLLAEPVPDAIVLGEDLTCWLRRCSREPL